MENIEIRFACMRAGVKQWQLAKALGLSETHFSKKLRQELPEEEKEKILEVIEEMEKEAI
ncbi:MAG: hypothetical protein IKJ99_04785 [Oscillospiraceae bacterium]|nr:hypothetical protein [Oscillospiraceae bacterium]